AIREVGARAFGANRHFLECAHTQRNFETAFYRSSIADNNSFEQWESEGRQDAAQRANKLWKKMLAEYEAPAIDPGIDEALKEVITKKKAAVPDSNAREGGRAPPASRTACYSLPIARHPPAAAMKSSIGVWVIPG